MPLTGWQQYDCFGGWQAASARSGRSSTTALGKEPIRADRTSVANPIIRTLVQIVSAAVALLVLFATYCWIAERSAEHKAREFCERLRVGMPVESLESRALADGAWQRETKWVRLAYQAPTLPVAFTGAFPMSRHICWVQGSPTIEKAEYVYLD